MRNAAIKDLKITLAAGLISQRQIRWIVLLMCRHQTSGRVSDITYIHTQKGFLFLAVVMDLLARCIVDWSISERVTDILAQDALTAAYWRRKPEGTVQLYSDQGSQHSSRDFRKLLSSLNMEASMSRRGNCWERQCRC